LSKNACDERDRKRSCGFIMIRLITIYIISALVFLECKDKQSERDPTDNLERLIIDIQSKDISVRKRGLQDIRGYGIKAKDAIPFVIDALGDDDENVKWIAIGTLGRFGADAKDCLGELISLAEDRHWSVRSEAICGAI